MPVKMDLRRRTHGDTKSNGCGGRSQGILFIFELRGRVVHGGGLARPVVAQEGGDLALVEADAEAVHGGPRAAAEHLDQVLDDDALHQVGRLCFEEGVA